MRNTTPFYTGKFMEELHRGVPKAFLVRLQAFFADFPYELRPRHMGDATAFACLSKEGNLIVSEGAGLLQKRIILLPLY